MASPSTRLARRVARWFRPHATRWARAGRGNFALVIHRGRKSGREYETPIQARPIADGFTVSLPSGSDVQWLRYIRAAGTCELVTRGSTFSIDRVSLDGAGQRLGRPHRTASATLHTKVADRQ